VKPPTFAPVYVTLYPVLAELARANGYALAVHGSVVSDFDLIAVPWTEQAIEADELVKKIIESLWWIRDEMYTVEALFQLPHHSSKPHGRRAWNIPLQGAARLDVSVVARIA